MNNEKRHWLEFLFLSLIIHFIILFFILDNKLNYQHFLSLLKDDEKPVEVVVVDGGDSYRQIVGIDDGYEGDKEENKDARYLGRVNRRVDKETQARLWGRPKNRMPKVQYLVEQDMQDAIGAYLNKRRSKPNSVRKNTESNSDNYGESTNYDFLPGVTSGENTILNTAEFVYYSFYKRVEDAVVSLWNRHVSDFIKTRPDVRENLGKKDYITEVEAVLDKDGNFIKMNLVRSSGVAGIDDAPSKAFVDASPFQNPPNGIIEKDGFIRMHWRFVVSIVENVHFRVQELDSIHDNQGRPDPALERHIR